MRQACDGQALRAAFRAAVASLEAHVDEINELNVYPVPDGDTGSNMLATVRAALDEADRVAEPTLDRVAAAISFGALMGARGNSGVITSQIFRGVADGLSGILVPPTDLTAVMDAARRLLQDGQRAGAMGLAGRQRAEREFAWTRVLRDLDAAVEAFTAPGTLAAARRAGR